MISKKKAKESGNKLEVEIAKIARKNKFKVVRNSYIGFKSEGKQKYTEVDLILISKKGIFIIESKNYNATVKGNIEDKILEIYYESGKKFNMYNPILQNETHKWATSNFLNVNQEKIQSIIVFSDSTNLKIKTKENQEQYIIKLNELDMLLKQIQKNEDIITEAKVNTYHNKLKKRTKVSSTVKKRHINQINKKKNAH